LSLRNELIVKVAIPLSGGKRMLSSPEKTRRHIADRAVRPARYGPPRSLVRKAKISIDHRHGWPVYGLGAGGDDPGRHVIFLHGGAYVGEIVGMQWQMLGRLAKEAPCRITVPIYPLGAAVGAARVVATATEIARQLLEVEPENVVLMGDSAGGGLALAIAQALRDQGLKPAAIVLISPWLDVAVNHPEQQALEPQDAMLGIPGLREAGRAYAAGLPAQDPRVSPLYGDFQRLPPITVFTGTKDLLNPDSHRLRAACDGAGVRCDLVEAAGMPHDYPLFPSPEGRAARRRIAQLIGSL
jgi:epsilon-lactone hydrolase